MIKLFVVDDGEVGSGIFFAEGWWWWKGGGVVLMGIRKSVGKAVDFLRVMNDGDM